MKATRVRHGMRVRLGKFPQIALLLFLHSCGESKPVPVAPPPMPAEVVGVSPVPLATGISYDTQIWAEMSLPLDPGTVNDRTVFLKLDTRRVSIDVRWDAPSRRVVITPLENMALFRTHTVELTPELRLEDGRPFDGYFWQFKTNSLRRLESPHPAGGSKDRSPFTTLMWDSTESAAGNVRYLVYVGADSVSVADRLMDPAIVTTRAYHVPAVRWTAGATYYWSVSAQNMTTGESLNGPAWRFGVVPGSATVDSVVLTAAQWGRVTRISGDITFDDCFGPTLTIGSNTVCAIDWEVPHWPDNAIVTGASLTVSSSGGSVSSVVSAIWGTSASWSACSMGHPGPPFSDMLFGPLASSVLLTGGRLLYESDLLAAHLQARFDGLPLAGYLLRSSTTASLVSPQSATGGPRLLVQYVASAAAGPVP